MPPLKVELSKSARARCQLTKCGKFIAKGELRVGTGVMMPGMEEYTYKFRHVCCFTKRQLTSVDGPSSFVGYDELCEEDQRLIQKMCRGECEGKSELIGRVSPSHVEVPTKAAAKAAKKAGASPAAKRGRDHDGDDGDESGGETPGRTPPARREAAAGGGAADDDAGAAEAPRAGASWPMSVALAATHEAAKAKAAGTGKPACPYGALCFRDEGHHRATYVHP